MDRNRDWPRAIEKAFDLGDTAIARALASLGRPVSYEAGQKLFECGAHADAISVVLTGEVDLCLPMDLLSTERGVTIDRVEEGAILGWSAVVNPFRYVLSAWAVGQVETLVFAPEAIREWCDENPKPGLRLQSQVANVIGGRLASMIRALRGEIEHSVRQTRRGGYE